MDKETWELAQKLRKTPRRHDTIGEANPLTGLLYCLLLLIPDKQSVKAFLANASHCVGFVQLLDDGIQLLTAPPILHEVEHSVLWPELPGEILPAGGSGRQDA